MRLYAISGEEKKETTKKKEKGERGNEKRKKLSFVGSVLLLKVNAEVKPPHVVFFLLYVYVLLCSLRLVELALQNRVVVFFCFLLLLFCCSCWWQIQLIYYKRIYREKEKKKGI